MNFTSKKKRCHIERDNFIFSLVYIPFRRALANCLSGQGDDDNIFDHSFAYTVIRRLDNHWENSN